MEGSSSPSTKHGHPGTHFLQPLFLWLFYGYLFYGRVFPSEKPMYLFLGLGAWGKEGGIRKVMSDDLPLK